MAPFYYDQESLNYYIMLLDQHIANYLKNIRSRLITKSYSVRNTHIYSSLNSGGISLKMG
jgi:hypothetical protein